ncbi:MAG: glycosyltransferase family 9 protein [bacterium]|nr:glycosyltransferase family 9 protein [bacterium]
MPNANLLIIHQGALGDFILTFPAITRLHRYYKPIDVLCQSQPGKLAKALGMVNNWYPAEAAAFSSLFSDQIDPKIKTILEQYDKVILFTLSDQLEKSINSVSASLSCRLPPKPPASLRIHVAQFILENISNHGLIKRADATLEDMPLPERKNQPQNPRKVLLHPGAGSIRKRWVLSDFLLVESTLKAAGLKPEFVLGPAERDLAKKLQQSDRPLHILDDLLDLLDLFKSAGGYIGNDSGASHLAAYSGLPTTVIFGPADPERWAPIGRAVQIVRPALQCNPCFETEPDNCEDSRCLNGTSPQKVVEVFYSVYPNPDKPENA